MARLPGLRKRTSKAEELALEEARQGSIARLERLLAHRAGVAMDDDSVEDEPTGEAAVEPGILALGPGSPQDPADGPLPAEPDEDAPGTAGLTLTASAVPVMDETVVDATRRLAVRHRPSAMVVIDEWDRGDTPPAAEATGGAGAGGDAGHDVAGAAAQAAGATVGGEPATAAATASAAPGEAAATPSEPTPKPASRRPRRRATAAAEEASIGASVPPVERLRTVPPPPPRAGAKAVPAHPKRPKRQPRQPVVLAACPSCAVLLDPRPTTSKRCSRCRERIVVKRVEGGVLYLTATAAAALEEAQRTVKVWARLARARDRWLVQAEAVGAQSQRIARIARPMPSEEQLAAARDLYLATADRAFGTARRERRFADAAAIRRAHALALYRDLGSPKPVPEAVVLLLRDATSAELRTLRDSGRDAELATTCCEACRVDAGRIVRISDELRTGRLPHATCEAGLCRCRWSRPRNGGRRPAITKASGR